MMDLVDEILIFSSVIQRQDENSLRDGLRIDLVETALTLSYYDDIESVTTVDGVGDAVTYKRISRKASHQLSYTPGDLLLIPSIDTTENKL